MIETLRRNRFLPGPSPSLEAVSQQASPLLVLSTAPEAFWQAVRLRLNTGLPTNNDRPATASIGKSWLERAAVFENYIGAWS